MTRSRFGLRTRLALHCGWFALLAAATACGGDGNGAGGPADPGAPNVTPEAGGTVTSDDGLVTLEVPAGAVTSPVHVSIRRTPADQIPGDVAEDETARGVYTLKPDGLTFAKPARMKQQLSAEELAAIDFGAALPLLTPFSRAADGTTEPLANVAMSVHVDRKTVALEGDVAHFSHLLHVVGPFEANLTPRAIDTVAPDSWSSKLEAKSMRTVSRTWSRALERRGLPNPPPFRVSEVLSRCTQSGVVESVVCERGEPGGPHERVDRLAQFKCDVEGQGTYGQAIEVELPVGVGGAANTFVSVKLEADAVCRKPDLPPPGLPPGFFDTVANVEGVAVVSAQKIKLAALTQDYILGFGAGAALPVPGRGARFQDFEAADASHFKADVFRWSTPSGPLGAIFGVGPGGFANRGYVEAQQQFSQLQLLGAIGSVITSFRTVPSASDPSLVEAVEIVNSTANEIQRVTPAAAGGFEVDAAPVLSASELSQAGIEGKLVDFIRVGATDLFGVTDQQMFVRAGGVLRPIGAADPSGGFRLLDCSPIEVAGDFLCAASNYVQGTVSSFFWSELGSGGTPTLDVQSGGGPIGVHVRGRQILYGGYTDDVVHLVTRPAADATTHETLDVSKDCNRPTAPKFADADSDQVVTNCNGNKRILVTKKGDLSGGS